jgi:signal transduction histidine kinase
MRLWRFTRDRLPDLLALAILVAAPLESTLRFHTVLMPLTATAVPAAILLLGRRRFPLLAGAGSLAVVAIGAVTGGQDYWESDTPILVALLAAWTLGRDLPPIPASLGAALGGLCLFAALALAPPIAHVNAPVVVAVEAGCFLTGVALRRRSASARELGERTDQVAASFDAEARRAVTNERARLAREVHDVVSHTVTVMTLQAGGARMLLSSDAARSLAAIAAVEQCGRDALGELRRMGEVLQDLDAHSLDPEPGVASLDDLIRRVRTAGLRVVFETSGTPDCLSPGLGVTVYRVVQEGLTNALRHGAGDAQLSIAYEPAGIGLEVINQCKQPDSKTGSGLVGLRERAALFGGSLAADRMSDGRFVLKAWLPVGES